MSNDLYIEGRNTTRVVKALANDIRLNILNLLSQGDMNVQTLANYLGLSKSTVLTHVNILEDAGFIDSQYLSGSVGNQRVCRKLYNRLIFNFVPGKIDDGEMTYYENSIPVGNYFDFKAHAPCGLARSNSIIKKWDDPMVMCDYERVNAVLVWSSLGYFEYMIPIDPLFMDKKVISVEIDMEISAHQVIKDHKSMIIPPNINPEHVTNGISDITFWVNGAEIGTHTVVAGIDREKATYTPTWWQSRSFSYGELVKVVINQNGCYIGGRSVSSKTFNELIGDERILRFRIGIKEDAEHIGGIALFGKDCGRYYQDIVVKTYTD